MIFADLPLPSKTHVTNHVGGTFFFNINIGQFRQPVSPHQLQRQQDLKAITFLYANLMITSLASQDMHLGDARSPESCLVGESDFFFSPSISAEPCFLLLFVVKENDRKEMVTVGVIYWKKRCWYDLMWASVEFFSVYEYTIYYVSIYIYSWIYSMCRHSLN